MRSGEWRLVLLEGFRKVIGESGILRVLLVVERIRLY